MTSLLQSENTVIGRLQIRLTTDNVPAAQHKIEATMRNANLRPSRLPASAILCLRKLRDPAPKTRWSGHDRVHPPMEWERSAVEELDRMTSQAVRPVMSAVPPSAEAVLFADRAEMLACLALDWLRGQLRTNWWWSTLLKQAGAEATLLHEWTESPEFVPLALEHLAARRQAVSFVRRLDDHVALSLLDRVLHVFGIRETSPSAEIRDRKDATETTGGFSEAHVYTELPIPPPWSRKVPEANSVSLRPLQQSLLGQGLMLRRAPSTVRSETFQHAVAEWIEAEHRVSQRQDAGPSPVARSITNEAASRTRSTRRASVGGISTPAEELNYIVSQSQAKDSTSGVLLETATVLGEGSPELTLATTNVPQSRQNRRSQQVNAIVEEAGANNQILNGIPDRFVEPTAPRETFLATSVVTDLAGIFFLVNVALSLNLYSDFTAPLGANLELDVWEFLHLLASKFVPDELSEDPIERLLLGLGSCDAETIRGSRFHPPETWSVPQSWLGAFPEFFEWKETVQDGRIQVAHPAGFLLRDEPGTTAECSVLSLDRWMTLLATYVQARLARALGREDAAGFLCRIPGRVEVTSIQINVHFNLASYPTEVRLAGLDRDPGWIPAAGRYVAYHFD